MRREEAVWIDEVEEPVSGVEHAAGPVASILQRLAVEIEEAPRAAAIREDAIAVLHDRGRREFGDDGRLPTDFPAVLRGGGGQPRSEPVVAEQTRARGARRRRRFR